MRLRRPCEHRQYDEHFFDSSRQFCPGGEFLPEDAIVIERNTATVARIVGATFNFDRVDPAGTRGRYERLAVAVLDALAADQVGEPG